MTCSACGTPVTAPGLCRACQMSTGHVPGMPAMRTSGMAIAGFVTSFFCGLLGLILSLMALDECKRSNGTVGGQGLAQAGVAISIVSMLLGLLIAMSRHR